MRRICSQRGFTLMEVLVAIGILSLGLAGAFIVAYGVTLSAAQLQDKTYAQWVAMNKIAEMRLQTGWPATGKSDGEAEMAGRTWHWVMEIKNTEDQDVRRLEVAVRPESEKDSKAPTVFLTSFLGKPL